MTQPNIKLYYWGYRNGEWNWHEAGYRLNGVERGDTGTPDGDFYPAAFSGPDGDYSEPSIVSDAIFSSLKPYATVPICIVNVGSGSLEETNIEVLSHFWATGAAEQGGGFSDTWWAKNKSSFGTAPNYTSSNDYSSRSDFTGNDNEDNNLWFGNGYRATDPSGIDPLPDSEDASTSKWATQTSDIYDAEHVGFGFIQSANGDTTLTEQQVIDVETPANRKSIFGNLLDGGTLNGYYARANYRSGGGFTQDEGIVDTFLRRPNGGWTANDINVWRMGHVWKTTRGASYRKTTPFGDYTIKNINGNSLYNIVYTNSDIMTPGRILRGYIYVSLYDKTSMTESPSGSIPGTISAGTGLEGVVFGRFFFTLSIFGRYYDV